MSVTIEGTRPTEGFIERILERAAEHPEAYGLHHEVGSLDFTWQEVAQVLDHDGVADGVIDGRDRSAYVDDGRTSRGAFSRLVASINRETRGETSPVRLDSTLLSDIVRERLSECEESFERSMSLIGIMFVNGEIGFGELIMHAHSTENSLFTCRSAASLDGLH